jgi:hypothetical protein
LPLASPIGKAVNRHIERSEGEMRSSRMCRPGAARRWVDADGDRIGPIQDVFLDRQTGQP